ncbi:type II toxin-antitoxin system RelE/ParE family toxin [Magnetococcus sp. PR-3]|uniref:type II toxin-antitoxin system RelE/ParE family toxin n=1 Tax=Magnetococcus sp. PR-3 TaxID=3120355 RepID=UPI002FCDE330
MKQLKLSRLAKKDLDHIKRYYDQINPEITIKIRDHLKKSFLLLRENPHAGHATNDYDVFQWHVPGTKYTLPYMIEEGSIIILRVYDERQDVRST